MSSAELTDAARRLLVQHIDAVGKLDLLLMLHGDPGRAWTAERMGRQMRASAKWAQAQMESLERARLLRRQGDGGDPGWVYDPLDAELARAVDDLVSACRLDWPGVTREVMSLRGGGAQAFSDAFRLRKRRDG